MRVQFENADGLKLVGILDRGSGSDGRGVVFCTHFTGFKEVRHYQRLSKELAKRGISSLRFDYSDCVGESEGSCDGMKLSRQALDTISAIDFMFLSGFESIGLFGHSLGGSTSIVTAANDRRVAALVTAASPAKLEWDVLFKDKAEEWAKTGVMTFPSWKRGEISIGYDFYRDLKKYDATVLVRDIEVPIRIIHPSEDELVSYENAMGIYRNANEPKELSLVNGSDHMFSSKKHEDELISLSVEWFERWL